MSVLPDDPAQHYYFAEDEPRVKALLGRQYHAVVANPPYITVRDRALNDLYRQRYAACHMKYSLVVRFIERCFELALRAESGAAEHLEGQDFSPGRQGALAKDTPAGYVGLIVANSFMKREFGKKLIEEFLPRVLDPFSAGFDLSQIA